LLAFSGASFAAPFEAGEEMNFEIRALGWKAAWQKVRVEELTTMNGRPAWRITSVLRTYPAVEIFYRLHDDSTTWLDAQTFQVLKVISKQEEGNWKNEAFITNSPTRQVVHYLDKHKGLKILKYEPPVLDLIGMIYYGRTLDLTLGKIYTFHIIDGPKLRKVRTLVARRDTRRTSPGYPDRKVPLLMLEEMGDSDVAVWFSDDNRKVPVRIRTMKIELAGIALGNIESILVKYKEK
jgi:hypothetical protein